MIFHSVIELFQPLAQAPESSLTLSAVAVLGVVTVILQLIIARDTRNKLEGDFGARLKANEKSIEELKTAKGEMWDTVNQHSVDIGVLKATHSKAHHA